MELITSHIVGLKDFLYELEAAEKVIEAYDNFNGKCPLGQKGIKQRVLSYKDNNYETGKEIENLKNFIIKYKDNEPDSLYNVKVPYIDKYDDYKEFDENYEKPTWQEKFSHLFKVFEELIISSLTADDVKVVEKNIQVQGLDANTFWTAEGAKATKRGVWVAAISLVVTALITVIGIGVTHHDAVLDRQNQAIEHTIPQSQSEPITPENSTVVIPTETL